MRPALEVENLGFAFDNRRPVLEGISFTLQEGECVGIVGANGAGKSTLLWCLLGLWKNRGTVRWFGQPPGRASSGRIGAVFQNPEDQLFMPTVLEDVALGLLNRGLEPAEARLRAREALEHAGLAGVAERPAAQLSLGERKRAAIAVALAGAPELLLLDEPTAELDGRSVRQLAELLGRLRVARLIASHHLDFLGKLCSRLLVLEAGRVIAQGPAGEILADHGLLERAGLV
ncbi:MAG: ABC transporter ATP-binding protein [Acidobacteria bacterium]|nr:ABC transporter ATP-binding protein [Acidobacteriota bacterium]